MSALLPLIVEGLELTRRGGRILGPISLRIDGAGITVVLGPNGAGKTSLLRALHGLERPSAGRVSWALPEADARARQAFVFQTPVLMRHSVRDCIAYPLRLDGVSRKAARLRAEAAAERVGLGRKIALPAEALSGGERQKLALARALVRAPDLLFLDEPCASLDGRATHEIEALLTEAAAAGMRVVMSTHDAGQARRLADEVLFLYRGRQHERSPACAFFDHPQTPEARAYLQGDLLP